MKSDIHPELHKGAKITCASCDATYEITTTVPEISVEKCRNCHPVYTGKEQQAATGGRVQRFYDRAKKAKK